MIRKKVICVDFDGVIHQYSGWLGKRIFKPPIDGVAKFLGRLKELDWVVIVWTSRIETDLISDYLKFHDIPFDHINHNPENVEQHCHPAKPIADVYLDDRAVAFSGVWSDALFDVIINFTPHWRPK